MPNYRLVAPYLRWGTNLANAIYFPFPSDSVFSGSEPRPGSEFIQLPSGAEAAWRIGTDYVWAGTQRWIAQSDTLFYPRCTGWDGTLGIRAALEALQNRQTFSWHPDGRNLLRLPRLNSAGAVANSGFGGWATATVGAPTGVTNAFSGAETAWQVTGTGAGGTCGVEIFQRVPCIPGETLLLSVDYKASGLTGGANGFIQIDVVDSSLAFLGTICQVTGLTTTSYTRASSATGTTPANAAYAVCVIGVTLPIGNAGTIFFRNAMIRRDSTDTTFIDNPSVDGVYFVEPTQLSPANEGDGSRQLVMRIRTPSAPFDGY